MVINREIFLLKQHNTFNMTPIENLIFIASLCLPIWMGDVMDYVHNLEDLFEVLGHVEEILGCIEEMY